MRKKGRIKCTQPKANLNLILWLSFSLFSLVVIVLFTVVQNVLISKRSRDQVVEDTQTAGTQLLSLLRESPYIVADDVSRFMLSVANQYGVSAYLFSADGAHIYPAILEEDVEKYAEIARSVIETAESLPSKEGIGIVVSSKDAYALAIPVTVWGSEHFLYVENSYVPLNELVGNLRWISVITALFAVVLGFVVSGFVSMVITKPVSEVTERAKALARGNYDVKFGGDSFCTEVSELSEALDYACSEVSKTDKMQKELIANVSHDFKTPLTMIKAYAAMIQEISGDDPEKRAKHTQVIIDEADRLAALVGDLLDLSKMQAGIDSFENTVFNLSEDVYRVTGRFDYLAETQGYVFETDIEDDLYTFASRARVGQVLYNLIGNAVNYTGEDKRVVVRLKKHGVCARFEVIDSGKGIAPEELDTIWERYYRSNETHKRPVKGTGLGLSIVKTILQRQGIDFGVTSELGKGSCFRVDFPMPPESD